MKRWKCLLLLAMFLMLIVTLAYGEKEKEIALSEVPEEVLEAAQEAVPGIEFTQAEIEETKEATIYELEGILDGKHFEIEITADGTVLEVEQEDDGNEDEEEDDDEDDDD